MSSSPASQGLSAPAEIVDPTHHGAIITITTAVGLLLVLICLLIRLYAKLTMRTLAGKTDIFLLGAALVALIQAIIIFVADGKGLGDSASTKTGDALSTLQKLVYTSDVFYLLTLYLSKSCVALIYLEITPNYWHHRITWAVWGLCTLWIVAGIFMISVSCELNQPWIRIANQCSNMYLRWALIAAFDCATEVLLVLISVIIVGNLQMPIKRKTTIISTFCARLPLIAFALVRLHYLKSYIHSSDPSLKGVPTFMWTEIDLMYSVIACTIYWLRPFMAAVSTHYGATAIDVVGFEATKGRTADYSHGSISQDRSRSESKTGTQNRSGGFRWPRSAGKKSPNVSDIEPVTIEEEELKQRIPQKKASVEGFRPDKVDYQANIRSGQAMQDAESVESNGSTRMIIKKQVEYRIDYGGRSSRQDQTSQEESFYQE